MLILFALLFGLVVFAITFLITRAICNVRTERRNRAFANLPREVLLTHATMSPVYRSHYAILCTIKSKEEATELITNRMLIDMGLIGYRKAET